MDHLPPHRRHQGHVGDGHCGGRDHSPCPSGGSAPSIEPVEPMEVTDKGWMAMLTDPAGAFFGLWQPIGHPGFEVYR